MVACKQCETLNGLDGKFCKSCGVALPEDEIREAIAREEVLIADGLSKLNAGMISDAMVMAEAVLNENPRSAHALSLMGMAHERLDQLAEAIDCYEKVVEVRPDSPVEKIKISHLRKALSTRLTVHPREGQRTAVFGAIAAAVFVICGAAMVAILNSRPAEAQTNDRVATNTPATNTNQNLVPFNAVKPTDLGDQVEDKTVGKPHPGDEPPLGVNNGEAKITNPPVTTPGRLPGPPAGAPMSGQIEPVRPPTNLEIRPETPPVSSGSDGTTTIDPDPQTTQNTGDAKQPEAEPQKHEPEPILEIRRSNGGARTFGGGQDVSSSNGNGLQALLRTANQQFGLGRYDKAATTYERALSSGGNSGSLNQRLGQCYEKLGRNGDAISAYTKAVAYYEDAARTDTSKVQALESCKQALKILRGG